MISKQWSDRKSRLVQKYDYWHDMYIPHRWEMIDVFATLKEAYQSGAPHLLDVGGGTGAVAHRLLEVDQEVHVDLLGGSPAMLEQGKDRLSSYQVRFWCRDLNESMWYDQLESSYPIITSNIAIHHLEDQRKKEVFSDIYDLLEQNGVFIYGDLLRFDNDTDEDRAYDLWTHQIRVNFRENNEPLREFNTMKSKLVDVGKEEGDVPATLDFVLGALREVGFREVTLVWFYIKFGVILGVK